MSNKSGVSEQIISVPEGGGAMKGLGEKFSPDLFTGTGNFTVPIALPPGRNGFQPQLNLVYSTGNSNGHFGQGWGLSIPGVTRKTSKGVPRYQDAEESDVFILSGAEDLVCVDRQQRRYRPRTEGLFADIRRIQDANTTADFWRVRSKDGLVSLYGADPDDKPNHATEWQQTPTVSSLTIKPGDPSRVFAWSLTLTRDPFGNRIEYVYERETTGADDANNGHASDRPRLKQIRYADYNDAAGQLRFLVSVNFQYEERPDPFSDYRAGFEIRTTSRCEAILIRTHADPGRPQKVREYRFAYTDRANANGVSLLRQVEVIGYDDDGNAYDGSDPHFAAQLPPLTFGYSVFDPQSSPKRDLIAVTGPDLPAGSLARPEYELADLTGDGLPDILEMNGTVRYWRNRGDGSYDLPRFMRTAPPVRLADPGVQLVDADGDGRIDLMVTAGPAAGVYPLNFNGEWDRPISRPLLAVPSFSLEEPEVRLVDLDGDGVTDVLRSGSRLEHYFYDRYQGWQRPIAIERTALEVFPNVTFSDPRVKLGDMNGDGLQDIVLIHNGRVDYWPNLGRGQWGRRITMRRNPRFADPGYTLGYDPRRLLVGDVDGDGLADLVYVENNRVLLWINQSGNGWSEEPIVIHGTPRVTDMDAVRLVDLLGSGISGVLWSADATVNGQPHMYFLDFTGGVKPYLLTVMDNHMGATTEVEYQASTRFYLEDKARREPWKTTLPFPVQVVARVEVIDHLSRGKLTTEYRYHHGYWDGTEREFRGFGMVEQLDTETFDRYNAVGLHGNGVAFDRVQNDRQQFFAQPTLTRTWFHLGPVGPEFGDWQADLDWSDTFWPGDRPLLAAQETIAEFMRTAALSGDSIGHRRARRDALRALRGSILRTELYALDRYANQDRIDPALDRPYTVTESRTALEEIDAPRGAEPRTRIFFPHGVAQRTTQWERGDDPLTQSAFTDYRDENGDFDAYGRPHRQTQIACPRGWSGLADHPGEDYLATFARTDYLTRDDTDHFMVDRVARSTSFEIQTTTGKTLAEVRALVADRTKLECIGQTVNLYDGEEYGVIGDHGALTQTESLAFSSQILDEAYGSAIPPYLDPAGASWSPEYPSGFQSIQPLVGHIYHDPSQPRQAHYQTGYFIRTQRKIGPRGLVEEQSDPLGNRTTIGYDRFDLLPETVTDARNLQTLAEHNYRVMQPGMITDPNGNRTVVAYSPIGLPSSLAVVGKERAGQGDRRKEGDSATNTRHVDYPSTRFEYGLRAYFNTEHRPPDERDPIFVRTFKRQEHFWDVITSENKRRAANGQPALSEAGIDALFPRDELETHSERFIQVREYSDGFGRLLQTRTQGEEERFGDDLFGNGVLPADQADTTGTWADVVGKSNTNPQNPNVVVSGWQTYDNKGRVVEKFEPFFDVGWDYQPPTPAPQGVKATMFYDPRGQVIRTLNPDGSEQRVIYGMPAGTPADLTRPEQFTPTPWETYTYDANDNAGRTHAATSTAYKTHHDTPASILIDALGRTIKAVQRLGPTSSDEIVTQTRYDIRGNPIEIVDPLGRSAFRHVFDLANRRLYLESIDAGKRWTMFDAAGNVIEARDGKGSLTLRAYDELNRPTHVWARNLAGETVTLRERLIYGDDQNNGFTAQQIADGNLMGKLVQHQDEAGVLRFEAYDFKGNLLEKVRWVIADSAITNVQPFRVNWDAGMALDAAEYRTSTTYDALNRVQTLTYPLDEDGERKVLAPRYNRAGALESVEMESARLRRQTYVERIAYNARGQRTLIVYGNGVATRYEYDDRTFRLTRLRTERGGWADLLLTFQPDGPDTDLQDLAYEYDLAGNITAIHDRARNCGLPAKPDELDRLFKYDAIYRLTFADGRECDTPPPTPPWLDVIRCQDVTRTRPYQQFYTYDVAGNMERLKHTDNPGGGFTRSFIMATGSNRLDHMTVGTTDYAYYYDDNGNMSQENSERHFAWDQADRLVRFTVQATPTSQASIDAHYLYDAAGNRVKKLVVNQQQQTEVTVYVDGLFEHHIHATAAGTGQNNTLHVMDNRSRVALVRVGTAFAADRTPAVKYHLGDHLGSSNVVIGGDDAAENGFINREEYYPYGETSFGSFGKKRYRYSGKERDEESGLYYYGARYLAPWLARWVTVDPLGLNDHLNLYVFVLNNPITHFDILGLETPSNRDIQKSTETGLATSNSILLTNSKTGYSVNIDPTTGIVEVKEGDWLTKYLSALTGSNNPYDAANSFEIFVDGNWVPFSEGYNPDLLEVGSLVRYTGPLDIDQTGPSETSPKSKSLPRNPDVKQWQCSDSGCSGYLGLRNARDASGTATMDIGISGSYDTKNGVVAQIDPLFKLKLGKLNNFTIEGPSASGGLKLLDDEKGIGGRIVFGASAGGNSIDIGSSTIGVGASMGGELQIQRSDKGFYLKVGIPGSFLPAKVDWLSNLSFEYDSTRGD